MTIAFDVVRSLAVAAAGAIAAYPAVRLGRRGRVAACLAAGVLVLSAPLLIAPEARLARLIATLGSIAVAVKLYDLLIGAKAARPPGLLAFAASLPNVYTIVTRKLDAEPRPPAREDLVRLMRATVGLAGAVALLAGLFLIPWSRSAFALEHAAKVIAVFVVLITASAAGASALRLVGIRVRELMDRPYAARTPAEFWRRHNRPAQQFFLENVFKPAGGLRAPVRATIVTFAVSALVHEYVFDVPNPRMAGYQTAFFMLQGCAVVASARVEPRGWHAVPWIAGTMAFNLASSVLFFACLDGIVPFYSHGLPAWLKR